MDVFMKKFVLFVFILTITMQIHAEVDKFLDLGSTAEGLIYGISGINVVQNAGSPLINPAGTGWQDLNWINISHLKWIFDTSLENFEFGFTPLKNLTLAGGISFFHTDEFDILNQYGDKAYTVSACDIGYYGSISRRIKNFCAGITGKMIYKKLGKYSATASGIDTGFRLTGGKSFKWNINLVIKNLIHNNLRMIRYETPLYTSIKFGGGLIPFRNLIISGGVEILEGRINYSVSINYRLFKALRLGGGFNSYSKSKTGGAIIGYKKELAKGKALNFSAGYIKMFEEDINEEIIRGSISYTYK